MLVLTKRCQKSYFDSAVFGFDNLVKSESDFGDIGVGGMNLDCQRSLAVDTRREGAAMASIWRMCQDTLTGLDLCMLIFLTITITIMNTIINGIGKLTRSNQPDIQTLGVAEADLNDLN